MLCTVLSVSVSMPSHLSLSFPATVRHTKTREPRRGRLGLLAPLFRGSSLERRPQLDDRSAVSLSVCYAYALRPTHCHWLPATAAGTPPHTHMLPVAANAQALSVAPTPMQGRSGRCACPHYGTCALHARTTCPRRGPPWAPGVSVVCSCVRLSCGDTPCRLSMGPAVSM